MPKSPVMLKVEPARLFQTPRKSALNPPPAKQAGEIIEDEDTNETVDKIVAWLEERKLL